MLERRFRHRPTSGGFLTDKLSWHWVFFINIPIGLVAILIFMKFSPKFKMGDIKHKIDYAGVAALIMVIAPAMLGLSWGGVNYDWNSPLIIGMLVFAGIMLVIFLMIESRAKEPIIPLSFFKSRIVSIANAMSFLTGMGMFGAMTFIPLFLQGVLGPLPAERQYPDTPIHCRYDYQYYSRALNFPRR